jgi:GTPase Era involved in 16S rRNA processing
MSAADGDMDAREKKYLQAIANRLGINPQYLAVLEAGFTHQGTVEPTALGEVQSLLDPARFHELDTMFVRAASDMLAALPSKPEHKGTQAHRASSYQQLKEFQKYRKQLDNLCHQVFQIIQDCANSGFLPETLTEEIGKVSRKLQSQRFRVAVVGEFSQGKSTLLNALLGQEIQPVREIPCSGTVTVLKYGTQKRVVCRYRDGREEEIPFDQYKEKAAIPEEVALGDLSDELAQSEIDEIVFEHPDLDLCSSGVEIIDSPGLNEHPARTAITRKLLKDIDAAIFLTNASRSLTQGERDLLQDLKSQLNGGVKDKPANNIFVVGNFIDLVRTEKGREQVQQRIDRFVQGQNPIVAGDNRVHFISAQSALHAILKGSEDEYLKKFQSFTQSIEKFLTLERGSLEIKQAATQIKDLIQASLNELYKAEDILEGHLKVYEDIHEMFEKIGEISGRDVQIKLLASQLKDEAIEEINESWHEWLDGLPERLSNKMENWSSEHSVMWSRDKLVKDYAHQFNQDLSKELETWIENQLKQTILKQYLEIIDNTIQQELQLIESLLEKSNESVKDQSNFNWVFYKNHEDAEKVDILGKVGFAVLGAVGIGGAVLAGGLILPIILGLANAGNVLAGVGGLVGLDAEIRSKVFEAGWEQFSESSEDVEKIQEIIGEAFYEKVEQADEIIARVISFYENRIELQEKAFAKTSEQCKADKAWISQKRQELEQVQKNIEAILPS